MKVLVAIPVYDAKLPIETVRCLLNEQALAMGLGDEFQILFLPSCSHPAMGRNQLVHQFLESEAERLVFLDSDVTFELGSLIKLAHYPVEVVGGAYRFKKDEEEYPVGFLPNPELWTNEFGLIEVETLPGGFLSIHRSVFEKFRAHYGERSYTHQSKTVYCYFQMPFKNGYLCGEDSHFCLEWRQTGGKVFLEHDLTLTHWQFNTPYVGHIGNWLKNRKA